jgi:hypothetical protein
MQLPKYSLGIGDRFAQQGPAQLDAVEKAARLGVSICPVWNKSWREHTIVGSRPADVRREADAAVTARSHSGPYFVDADHVGLKTVEHFLDSCDFFTLDVAEQIGGPADQADLDRFIKGHRRYLGRLTLPGDGQTLEVSEEILLSAARKYLPAVREAGRIYRRIVQAKGLDAFVTEVSMDETDAPQTPLEMFFILAALADEDIPVQTIAPRFSGRFNKGVDYVGDVAQFTREFRQDLWVIQLAVREFGLPDNLKLSVHSGSDKFSLYGPMQTNLRRMDAGVHLKTAGTTWLEELVGLAIAGDDGLGVVKQIYCTALGRIDELTGPYTMVIDIDRGRLPSADAVSAWDGPRMAAALRHDRTCPDFNPHLRQLLHVAYKIAAELGETYGDLLRRHADVVAQQVTTNIFDRHIRPLFLE